VRDAALPPAHGADRPRRDPPRGARPRAAAGCGAGVRQADRAARRRLSPVAAGQRARAAVRDAHGDRGRRGAGTPRRLARAPPRQPARDAAAQPAAAHRGGGGLRRRVPRRGAARRLLAGRPRHREADGHGVPDGDQREHRDAAARPVDVGRGPQLLLPRPLSDGVRDPPHRGGAERGLQPRGRADPRALRRHRLRAGRDADRHRGRTAPRADRHRRGAARVRRGNGRLVAPALHERRPAARLRLVRPLAGHPGRDLGVPGVLLPARRPARPRARHPVHPARARLRAAGRADRDQAARRHPRRHRRRDPLRDQLLVVPGGGRDRRALPGPLAARAAPGLRAPGRAPARRGGVEHRRPVGRGDRRPAVLADLRRRDGRDRRRGGAALAHALRARPDPRPRRVRLGARRSVRAATARHEAPAADRRVDRDRRDRDRLAARAGRPRRPRAPRRARRGGAAGRVGAPHPRRALRLAPDRGGARVRARARAPLRARRVRRLEAVPHEHDLQARLPGLDPARLHGRVPAALGATLAPRAGVADLGARRARPARADLDLPVRRHLRAQGRLLRRPAARRAALARARRAGRRRGDRLAARQRRGRRRDPRGGRRRLLRVRPRADLDLLGPADGARVAGARAAVGPRPRAAPRGRRADLPQPRPGRRPAAAAPLRRRLRGRRAARARRLRRRRPGQVRLPRPPGARPRGHDRVAVGL
ncbi:MAG: hypothetical protein AVDCRST_MAG30-3280, partial [uncultured Solirubrobacteraceae bacterium]